MMVKKINGIWVEQKVKCRICGTDTYNTGTKLCDRCWELERRISQDVALTKRILKDLENTK